MHRRSAALLAIASLFSLSSGAALADEIKVLTAGAFKLIVLADKGYGARPGSMVGR